MKRHPSFELFIPFQISSDYSSFLFCEFLHSLQVFHEGRKAQHSGKAIFKFQSTRLSVKYCDSFDEDFRVNFGRIAI